jgi:hypothetical protein
MGYRQRKIILEKLDLLSFIRRLRDGRFLIPSFQRLFVWDPAHIASLWDSIFQGYPIGSIIYWETPLHISIHRRVGGLFLPRGDDGQKSYAYILDGQQRATALFIAFYGGRAKVDNRPDFDYTMHFNLATGHFFFESDFQQRLNTPDQFIVRLRDVPSLPVDFGKGLSKIPGYNQQHLENLERLQEILKGYEIPLIRLQGFDVRGVCGVFERINQGGVKLEDMDIYIARTFNNNKTIIEEDIPPT